MPDQFEEAVEALFEGIDVVGARATLKELRLPAAYSLEAVDAINAAANKLGEQAADLKRKEAPRAKRLEVRQKIDRLVNARALLYRLRPAQPGDVVAVVGP